MKSQEAFLGQRCQAFQGAFPGIKHSNSMPFADKERNVNAAAAGKWGV
jgi:hypothetical protein